jgi:hypothetical protein
LPAAIDPVHEKEKEMSTDIKLDEVDGNWLILEGAVVKTTASDLMIDSPGSRSSASGFRRALVHDQRDGLTINFNADYPGGVTTGGNLKVNGAIQWNSASGPRDLSETFRELSDITRELSDRVRELERQSDMERIRRLEAAIESIAALLDASIVPPWFTVEEVEHGDDMGLVAPSAEQLGLRIQYTDRHGRFLQGIPPEDPDFMSRHVLSLRPEAGTMLRRDSEVVVKVDYDG